MSRKAKKAVSRSPAEFFADNKSIAGFDNVGRFHAAVPPLRLIQRAEAFACVCALRAVCGVLVSCVPVAP